jgi:hypothetical protein
MPTSFCSEALRTIGYDLEFRGIKTFCIRCDADLFVVEGGYQSPPAVTPVTLHYSSSDIEQLERKAREKNDHVSAVKDFSSLSQILWAIGTYVTVKEARLLTVSNTFSTETRPIVKIEYERDQGDRVVEDLAGSAIYQLCVSVYKLRGSIKKILNTRFSTLLDSSYDSSKRYAGPPARKGRGSTDRGAPYGNIRR